MDKEHLDPKLQTELRSRNSPGRAAYTRKLKMVDDPNWLNGKSSAMLPGQTAERLQGRHFNSFDQLRSAIWEDIGNDPILSRGFSTSNQALMRSGRAPIAPTAQQRGNRIRFELDHSNEIQDKGSVYDLSNLRIKTPAAHIRKITRAFRMAAEPKQ